MTGFILDSFTSMEFKTSAETLVRDSFGLLMETPALSNAVTGEQRESLH